jgi:acyl carrier protein
MSIDSGTSETMRSRWQPLVHYLLASQLQIADELIEDGTSLDELGLDPLDLLFFVLRLEELTGCDAEFPHAGLDHVRTVGELVALVDLWGNATMSSASSVEGPRSSSAA